MRLARCPMRPSKNASRTVKEVKNIAKRINVNKRIRAKEVRLIDADGKQLGVVAFLEALATAKSQGLDLVEVSPNVTPPVCRIMDYGRYKYQQKVPAEQETSRGQETAVNLSSQRDKTASKDRRTRLSG